MIKIDIEADELQEFKIPFEDSLITIILSFRDGYWFMNTSYKDKVVNGLKLSSAVLMLQGKNLPFEILIDDKGLGTDPFSVDCFELGIFDFYILEREELEDIRGFEVA